MSRKGGEEVEKEEQRLRGLEALRQLHSAQLAAWARVLAQS